MYIRQGGSTFLAHPIEALSVTTPYYHSPPDCIVIYEFLFQGFCQKAIPNPYCGTFIIAVAAI